jgi:hypothetical protein
MSLIVNTVLLNEIVLFLLRVTTGQLFTDKQIKAITSHSVGQYFSSIFPEETKLTDQRHKIEAARVHIESAASIITEMRGDLEAQRVTLDLLLSEISEKRSTAHRYRTLAEANKDAVAALRTEMEDALRKELDRNSKAGSTIRRALSGIWWLTTLVLGAALGAYFKDLTVLILAFWEESKSLFS